MRDETKITNDQIDYQQAMRSMANKLLKAEVDHSVAEGIISYLNRQVTIFRDRVKELEEALDEVEEKLEFAQRGTPGPDEATEEAD